MEVKVLFFGVLAEVAGTRFRSYNSISSMGDLKLKILDDYPEFLHYNYRICHNRVLRESEPALADGDEIALLPPFEGG